MPSTWHTGIHSAELGQVHMGSLTGSSCRKARPRGVKLCSITIQQHAEGRIRSLEDSQLTEPLLTQQVVNKLDGPVHMLASGASRHTAPPHLAAKGSLASSQVATEESGTGVLPAR